MKVILSSYFSSSQKVFLRRGGVGHPLTNPLFPKNLGPFKPFTLNRDRELLGKFSDGDIYLCVTSTFKEL